MTDNIWICTGHRYSKLNDVSIVEKDKTDEVLHTILSYYFNNRDVSIIRTGMALGFDLAVADFGIRNNIPVHAYIPYVGQEYKWSDRDKKRYENLISNCSSISIASDKYPSSYKEATAALYGRNRILVKGATNCVALKRHDINKGGTVYTMGLCDRYNVIVDNIWDSFSDLSLSINLPISQIT